MQVTLTPSDKVDEVGHLISQEAAAPSSKPSQQFWIDGYICSLCGFELPPGFEEERQEHSDFHLAEKLQQEEAIDSTRHTSNERYISMLTCS
jgi:DNA polymerase kappa